MRGLRRTAIVALLSLLPMVSTQAAPTWYDVEINMAGMSANGTLFIRVTDLASSPAFTNLWIIGNPSLSRENPSLSREMLATALAAMTNDMVAFVNTDPTDPGFPLANNLYLKK
jgi:hypothetical protein